MLFLLFACSIEKTQPQNGSNDTSEASDSSDPQDTGEPDSPQNNYLLAGPYQLVTTTSSVTTGSCDMEYTLFSPSELSESQLVVLSHGFQRSADNMNDWAEHFATWGFRVAVPSLCHSSILDVDHSQNAIDIKNLASSLGGDPIYAGQSAGGLSSLIAAYEDSSTVGVLGLDATNTETSESSFDPSTLNIPIMGLAGEPSSCNANGSGVELYNRAQDSTMLRVTEADHCDFESPSDWLCTTFCPGTNAQFSNEQIQDTVLLLSTTALLMMSTTDEEGSDWWTPGNPLFDELLNSGKIQGL